jgi:hypothetical protein
MKNITFLFAVLILIGSSCTPKVADKIQEPKSAVEEKADDAENAAEEVVEEAVEVAEKPKVDRSLPMEEEAVKVGETITKLKIYEDEVDLGTIEYGDSVTHTFKYKNIGNVDFFIEQYTVGCGCTELIKPKKRIAPGEMGSITLQFNSKEKDGPGDYTSDVLLICNVGEGFLEFGMKIKVVAKK